MRKKIQTITLCLLFFFIISPAFANAFTFADSTGQVFTLNHPPHRVVSLVPSVTEMIFQIGGGNAVVGVTYPTSYPPAAALKPIVGGFLFPSVKRIAALHPDLIFASKIQKKGIPHFSRRCPVVILEANSLKDIYHHLRILGNIFQHPQKAEQQVVEMKRELALIAKKVARIPMGERKRVMRIMGRNQVMAPGDNSFQDEYIRLAGGIPPTLGKKGAIVPVSKEQWIRFNPQIVYGCGGDRSVVKNILSQPGWRDVAAVRNKAIYFFPCALTCRASTHAAYFIAWLSSTIYGNFYAKKANQVTQDHIVGSKPISLPFKYVKSARIIYSRIADFINKTLLIRFRHPLKILSTLEGPRDQIANVGNHDLPPQVWRISYRIGFRSFLRRVYGVLGLKKTESSLLLTGADMDNLSIQSRHFKALRVTALVTAGVRSNAMRMSKDEGKFYEPGTINILLLTNTHLTPRAMARAVITATEAKTAALQDLDIRSAYTGQAHQATGTGTDNILVVGGEGVRIDNTGGHSRMGELIAKAVYAGVQKAIFKQNGIIQKRNVFQRLLERKISLFSLVPKKGLGKMSQGKVVQALETTLLCPRYATFIKTALVISDNFEAGLISNLTPFRSWCVLVASRICGKRLKTIKDLVKNKKIPKVMRMAFNGLLTGIAFRQ